jgi:hypothetical protein
MGVKLPVPETVHDQGGGFPPRGDKDRGRDAYHYAPPAQNRTCGFPAYGFHLGYLTAKR